VPHCTLMRCARSWRIALPWRASRPRAPRGSRRTRLRVGFITAAYNKGVRDEDIMRHTRHRDLRTMRGYVQRAGVMLAAEP
jgi:hypothetical protein